MELYRPISEEEYRGVEERNFRGFPPREQGQQLFTALLSAEGASLIARRMRFEKAPHNTVYVVSFMVEDSYIRQYPVQHADQRDSRALWIPAEEVDCLNQHLVGEIRLVAKYETDRADADLFFA